ncbi:MAG: ABC transporter permease subunit [Mariniblastus sp.]
MFNRAIFWKTWRDSSPIFIAAAIGMTAFVVLFVQSMFSLGTELMEFVSKFEFLAKIFEFGFGIDPSGEVSLTILFTACFTHAMILLISWSTIIATTTRVTAGEIEKGTADLLLSLPVTRREVYLSTSLVWLLSAMILAVCPVMGVWIGLQVFETEEAILIRRFFPPAVNFFFVLIAVGGISSMFASLVDRRGLAIALIAGFLISSVVLNFVEPFIPVLSKIRWLGLLSYFRPVDVVRSGEWPWFAFGSLFAIGAVTWAFGMTVFCRRDIPTA